MKKIALLLLLFTTLGYSQQETFNVTFETNTDGNKDTNWLTFENYTNPIIEIVGNPDNSGINTSPTVAKFTALKKGNPWAGIQTAHRGLGEWILETGNNTISITVYKTEISEVGIEFRNPNNGIVFNSKKSNTTINSWETITYNIPEYIINGTNNIIDRLIIFPDWQDNRLSDNIVYIDNITWEAKRTAEAINLKYTDIAELPIDFTDHSHRFTHSNDNKFEIIKDPNNSSNYIGKVTSSNKSYSTSDNFSLKLSRFIDLSDSANNSISFDIYSTTSEVRKGNIIFEEEASGGEGVVAGYETSGSVGWETITIDFDNAVIYPSYKRPVTLTKYGKITLSIGTYINGRQNPGTITYIDDIRGAKNSNPFKVFSGNASLTTQEEVNEFGINSYSKISGALKIGSDSFSSNINDLTPLNSIYEVVSLEIINNDNLINLNGLENLRNIKATSLFGNGSTIIKNNKNLKSISSLSNLTNYYVGLGTPGFIIDNNDALESLEGLQNIYKITSLELRDNDALIELTNLNNVNFTGNIIIDNNKNLKTINNLHIGANFFTISNNESLTSFSNVFGSAPRGVFIDNNDNLISLSGLENLKFGYLEGIRISNNDKLKSLNGLSTDLSETPGFYISNNPQLINIDLFYNLTNKNYGITIINCPKIPSLIPLSNYKGGSIKIDGNNSLSDLNGLQNFTDIFKLSILNTSISSLNGIAPITEIENTLHIENNPNITSLDVFNKVELIGNNAIETNFKIINNKNINSLKDFDNLTEIKADLEIRNNELLNNFCGIKDALNNNFTRKYNVSGNLYNPKIKDIKNDNCSVLSNNDFLTSSTKIFPNPISKILTIKLPSKEKIKNFSIYSANGREIFKVQKEINNLDMSFVENGIYFLKIETFSNKSIIRKIIKN